MSGQQMNAMGGPEELAAEYVLGTLPLEERRAVQARMAGDPALREAVGRWEARLLPLVQLAEPVEPSAQLWPRIAASLSPATQTGATGLPWWNRLGLWRGLAAAGFALALLTVAIGQLAPDAPGPRYMVVLASPENMSPGWVLEAKDVGQLRLLPLRPTAVPTARALQLWTKADGWSKPVSLGLVEPGKEVDVALRDLPPLQPNQLFEITLEPESGSPTGRPTGPILYIGRAVRM